MTLSFRVCIDYFLCIGEYDKFIDQVGACLYLPKKQNKNKFFKFIYPQYLNVNL